MLSGSSRPNDPILVQTRGFSYKVVNRKSLEQLTDTNAPFWVLSADDAVRADVSQHVRTICSLRDGNDKIAKRVMWGLRFQLLRRG